jgi:hypothetical protein
MMKSVIFAALILTTQIAGASETLLISCRTPFKRIDVVDVDRVRELRYYNGDEYVAHNVNVQTTIDDAHGLVTFKILGDKLTVKDAQTAHYSGVWPHPPKMTIMYLECRRPLRR